MPGDLNTCFCTGKCRELGYCPNNAKFIVDQSFLDDIPWSPLPSVSTDEPVVGRDFGASASEGYVYRTYGIGHAVNSDGTIRPLTAEEQAWYDRLLKEAMKPL